LGKWGIGYGREEVKMMVDNKNEKHDLNFEDKIL